MSYNNMKFATNISKAILNGTEKILQPNGKILMIPAGQKSGTDFQKQTYADSKAIEMIEKMEEDKKK
tara:strand:- start:1298 stop:1498 length:201 start_codon:yes stop_codon:yes gene_type:complete